MPLSIALATDAGTRPRRCGHKCRRSPNTRSRARKLSGRFVRIAGIPRAPPYFAAIAEGRPAKRRSMSRRASHGLAVAVSRRRPSARSRPPRCRASAGHDAQGRSATRLRQGCARPGRACPRPYNRPRRRASRRLAMPALRRPPHRRANLGAARSARRAMPPTRSRRRAPARSGGKACTSRRTSRSRRFSARIP